MLYDIPGYKKLNITKVVMDYNGTIAVDGKIGESIKQRLALLSKEFQLFVLTADTYGTAGEQCRELGLEVKTFPQGNAGPEKEKIVRDLGADSCVCLGNGRNDEKMFALAALSIAIMDGEGLYGPLVNKADLCVRSAEDGLDLLRFPKRIIAGLRG